MSACWLVRAMLHTLVLSLAFSLSGVAGAFEPRRGNDERECCADCPVESQGKECPPGCPNCHCAHGSLALPKQTEARVAMNREDGRPTILRPEEATAPCAPTLRGVYRPPRSCSLAI